MKSLLVLAILALMMAPFKNASAQTLDRNAAFAQVQSNAGQLVTGLYSGDFPPADFKQTLYMLTEDLYNNGFISLTQMSSKKSQVDVCLSAHNTVLNTSGLDLLAAVGDRGSKCSAAVDYNGLKNSPPGCINANQVLAGAQCCNGLVPGVSRSLEATLAAKKTNEICSDHSECASKNCNKDEGAASGLCKTVMTCFPLIPIGGECSPENPNCSGGVCRPQQVGLGGVNCKSLQATCSSDNECCTTRCKNSKCEDKYLCEKCILEGQKPTGSDKCCRGLIKDLDGICTLEMPPFILPTSSSAVRDFWKAIVRNINPISSAQAMVPVEVEQVDDGGAGGSGGSSSGGTSTGGTSATGSSTGGSSTTGSSTTGSSTGESSTGGVTQETGTFSNDDALTAAQLDLIEDMIGTALTIKNREARKAELLKIYAKRKQMAADNAAAAKAGNPVGKTFTQEEYVKRYNIPAITPKGKSDITKCEFNTVKDNWIDSSNLMRNADLFVRSFEVSLSGKGTQDLWHLPDSSYSPHQKNLYSRSKEIMNEVRDNRNYQRDELKYLDLIMACQCIYAFGPEKFAADKKSFFFSQCRGRDQNKICTADQLKMDGSSAEEKKASGDFQVTGAYEEEFRQGKEFPDYVAMYLSKLEKLGKQGNSGDDVENLDSGAAGINHQEILVRWLKLRSCNQTSVFINVEKVEGEVQTIVEDLNRAKKPNPSLTSYWTQRIQQMKNDGVPSQVTDAYSNDKTKDSWYRGYVHTQSKFHSWTKKTMKFLLFLIIALLAFFILGPLALAALTWTAASILGAYILIVGIAMTTGNNSAGSAAVMESFSKDFPNVVIEDRLVEKTSCGFLKLFWCKTFYRILHWPAYSNRPGIQSQPALQWTKRPETSCDDTYNATVSYQGVQPNPCSGPFKGTMCARSFFRPLPDSAIADKAEFAPWKEVMRDKMLMDPATPEFYSEQLSLDNQWIPALNSGFKAGCNWIKGLGKSAAKAEDKFRFFPDFKKYIDSAGTFLPAYQFNQTRINAYKAAIKRYALCGRMTEWGKPMPSLYDCGATMYDGKHPEPTGFGDVFEDEKTAELYANYVYQLHFNWRYMSGNAGIGYPLAYAENYYTALLHNFRLLTTLTIRKGIELDDAYQKYAEDLAVKRSNYQLNNNQYGIKSEKDSRKRVLQNVFYAKLKGLGFPLSAEFSGLPSGGGLTAGGTADQGDAAGTSLSGKELSALNAAKRHANRVAKDNKAWKNFQDQTKDDPDAQRRLAATTNFFGKMNSPLSAVPGMSKPGDNSSYSGIGGKLSGGLGARSGSLSDTDKDKDKESSQKYGPVGDKSSSGAAGGYSAGANGDGSSGFGGNGSPSDGFENSSLGSGGEGDANGAGANGGLSGLGDSSRITGMKEGDLQNMLDSADKDRDKLSSGEADSLFQKVSKAYLRNLDRVLVGKKGRKEVPKAEKKEVRDSEKEEINKIFNQ